MYLSMLDLCHTRIQISRTGLVGTVKSHAQTLPDSHHPVHVGFALTTPEQFVHLFDSNAFGFRDEKDDPEDE